MKKVISRFFSKPLTIGNKGFSLIGVMVASAIGLVIVSSITHLFVQMSSRLTQLENKQKRMMFYDYLINHLGDPTQCLNTMNAYGGGTTWDLPGLKVDTDANFTDAGEIDFYSAAGKKRLKDDFGIGQFNKLEYTHATRTLSVVTLSHIQGQIPIFNKPLTISLTINPLGSPPPPPPITGCEYSGHTY